MAVTTVTKQQAWSGQVGVLAWVTIRNVDGLGNPLIKMISAEVIPDPSTYAGGLKLAQVLQFGTNSRTVSDIKGRSESAKCSITLKDDDGSIRAWFTDPVQRNAFGLEVSINFRLSTDRANSITPAPNWHGLIKSYRAVAGGKFQIDCWDLVSSLATAPVPMVSIGTFFPQAPTTNLTRRCPRWYGRLSDEPGTTSTGAPVPALESGGTGCTAAAPASSYVTVTSVNSPGAGAAISIYGNIPATVALAGFSPMPSVGANSPPGQPLGLTLTNEALISPPFGAPGSAPGNDRNQEGGYRVQVRAISAAGVPGDPTPWLIEESAAFELLPLESTWVTNQVGNQIDVNWSAPASAATYEVAECQIAPVNNPFPFADQFYRFDQIIPVSTVGMGSGMLNGIYAVPNPNVTPINTADIQGRLPDFASRYVYRMTWLTATGETAPSLPWINRPSPWARPVRLCAAAAPAGAIQGYMYRADLNIDGTEGTYTRRWSVPLSSVNGAGQIVFTDDLLDTGVTTVSGIGGSTGPTATTQGVVPTIDVGGPWIDNTGVSWDRALLVAGHACKGNFTAYERLSSGGTVTALASLIDSQISIPGQTGYSTRWGSAPYTTRSGRRFTLFYIRGTLAADVAANKATVWVNGDFVETVGDGSGTRIDSPVDQLAHLWDNDIGPFALGQAGYAGGNWATTIPAYGDGRASRNATTFAAAKSALATILPADLGAWGLTADRSCADTIAALCVDCDSAHGADENGAITLMVEAPNLAANIRSDLPLTDISEIVDLSLSWQDQTTPDYYFNQLTYDFAPSWDASGSTTAPTSLTIPNSAAITNMRGRVISCSETLSFLARRDAATAQTIATRVLNRAAPAPRDATLKTSLFAVGGSGFAFGDQVPVTSPDGAGPGGWIAELLQIRGISTSWDANSVDLAVRGINTDVETIMLAAVTWFFGGNEAVPVTNAAYPSGSTGDTRAADTNVWLLDSGQLGAGTTAFEVDGYVDSGGTLTVGLFNMDDNPNLPIAEVVITGTVRGRGVSATILSAGSGFAAPGVQKNYGIKAKASGAAGYFCGARTRRAS